MESTIETNAPKNSLFIGDLSIFCTEKDLEDHFLPFGALLEVKIMKSEDKGRNLSYGFVKFADPNDALNAMNTLNNSLFQGRNLRIAWASYRNKSGLSNSQTDTLESSAVHVSFISYQIRNLVTESSLRELFSRFGEVSDVSIKKSAVDRNINRQSGYGFIHFPISHEGISAAVRAVDELKDTTVEEVNYKSSLSHKLTLFIEENRAFFSSNQITRQIPPVPRGPIDPGREALQLQQNARSTHPRYNHYSEVQPSLLPSPIISHRANYVNPYPATSVPMPAPHYAPPASEPRFVVPPMLPLQHYMPPSPSQPQFSYESHLHFGAVPVHNFGMFPHSMGSPIQPSPQGFYVNDARYGCTPSSISSVETFYDHLAGAVLVSPDYPSNNSPQTNFSQPLSSSATRNSNSTVRNSNLNLKKLRQGSLRARMNQLEGSETKGGEISNESNSKPHSKDK